MKYILNEYHRDILEEELLKDLQRISDLHHGDYISRTMYEKEGRYSGTPFIRRWGSWIKTLAAAGLVTERKAKDYKRITDTELLDDVGCIARELNKKTVTTKEYSDNGRYKVQTLLSRFGSWNETLKRAGLEETGYKVITNLELFEEIERLWREKGSQPTTTDLKNGNSIYSLNTFSRRFGGWRNALIAFLEYIENDENLESEEIIDEVLENKPVSNQSANSKRVKKRKTTRDINMRLRFRVLQRDNFKCCACGASPAKDPTIELHVDHIIPWAKGGETEIDNLQTLCSVCNWGKGDYYEK